MLNQQFSIAVMFGACEQNEIGIFMRTSRGMARVMCGVTFTDKK